MNERNSSSADCPDLIVLNEVYDRVCADEKVLSHTDACPACRDYLEGLKRLDLEIAAALDANTSADFPERCCAALHQRLELKKKKFEPLLFFSRVAALFAMLSIVGYLIWNGNRAQNQTKCPIAHPNTEIASSAAVPAALREAPALPLRYGAVDVAELSSVSFLEHPVHNGEPIGVEAVQNYVRIPSNVTQIWTTRIPGESSGEKLLSILARIGVPADQIMLRTAKDGIHLNFRATKMQTVHFVRACKHLGFLLNSPIQPQPEQKNFLGNASDMIFYSAEFLPR